jgi:putative sterol carrier protein
MRVRQIFEERLPSKITKELASSIAKSFQFHITGDSGGDWYVDLSEEDNWVGEGKLDAPNCTVTMGETDFVSLMEGTLKPEMAVMMGKAKVAGDLVLALKLKVFVG